MSETTANLGMTLGTVSETLGPEWAEIINAALRILDLHDHSEGDAKITPAGMSINDDLSFEGNAVQNAKHVGLTEQADGNSADNGAVVRIGTNLWWKNSAGALVQLTSGTSLATPGTGAISASAPGAYPYTVVTGDAQKVLVIDSSAARTLNLPAATNAMFFMVKDGGGAAQTNNISIVPDGTDTIDGSNSTYLVDANYASVGLVSDGVSKWFVV